MRMVYFHVYVSISVLIYHSVDEGYHIEGIRHRVNKPLNSNKEQQSKAFHTDPMDRTKIPISHGTSFVKYYVVKMNLSGFGPIFSSQQTIIYTATKTDDHMIIFSYMFK